jgi:hypothetical protein
LLGGLHRLDNILVLARAFEHLDHFRTFIDRSGPDIAVLVGERVVRLVILIGVADERYTPLTLTVARPVDRSSSSEKTGRSGR